MATALLDLGFLGAIGLLLWLAERQERWLDREERVSKAADDLHDHRRAA